LDKNWSVCDNTASSPHYGNCYTEWDSPADGNLIQMSVSSDGGLTWSSSQTTADSAAGIGGQPVVAPNGNVIVPIADANETSILAFVSTNGGVSWGNTVTIAAVKDHTVAGNLRTEPLPSAEIDEAGKVYVVWQDCRFIRSCKANDIVMSTSTDGTNWSSVVRIPIDSTRSGVDHFIPGLAVDRTTSGSTAHLSLTFYYYPVTNCSTATCQLEIGYVSSANGGSSWTSKTQLAGPMNLSWLPNTTQGVMVGDYISSSFASGMAHPVFAVAHTPVGGVFDQEMYAPASGLGHSLDKAVVGENVGNEQPVPNATSDHPAPKRPVTLR
jgi:hypothetical protein